MLFDNSLKINSAMDFILMAEGHSLMGYLTSLAVGKNLLDELQLIPHIARFNLVDLPEPVLSSNRITELVGYTQHEFFHLKGFIALMIRLDDLNTFFLGD